MESRNPPNQINLSSEQDRISNLPEPVLHRILSFLDLKQAIQTSVLSTKWRYLSRSLPSLYFNCNLFATHKAGKAKAFKEFVDQVLLLRDNSSILRSFRLDCYQLDKFDQIYRHLYVWILTVLKENFLLQELYLNISVTDQRFRLTRCLFSCKSLVILEVKLSSDSNFPLKLNLPDSMSLPQLKTLILHYVLIEDDDIPNMIFRSCPVLESLTITKSEFRQSNIDITSLKLKHLEIENCYYPGYDLIDYCFKLYAPNLVSFRYKDFFLRDYSMANLSALVDAEIDIEFKVSDGKDVRSLYEETRVIYAHRMFRILRGLQNVDTLTLSAGFLEVFFGDPGVFANMPIQLRNLKRLKLRTMLSSSSMEAIEYILQNSPHIESLLLEINKDIHNMLPMFFLYWDELKLIDRENLELFWKSKVPLYMLNHLKVVEIRGIEGRVSELHILEYLLKYANVLDKLLLYTSKEDSPDREKRLRKFTDKLLDFPRASSSIAILFS